MTEKLKNPKSEYTCEYCNKGFAKESTLQVHVCEQKRRMLQKSERSVMFGYQTFVRFYQLSANFQGIKTYEEFCKSPFYNAFVKFGSFMSNVKPLYPEKYIDWIVTGGEKIDNWAKDELYEKYVVELIFKENVETALERSINTMTEWATENNSVWNHYFSYINHNRAIWHIKDGKMSPWLLLNCDSGKKLLKQFNNEQLSLVYQILDPQKWSIKFKKYPADLLLVKDVAVQANL
jgi:hypothetical protein